MKQLRLLFVVLTLWANAAINPAFSQSNSNVDSLKAVLSKYPHEDIEKAKLLVKISEAFLATNAKEGIVYSNKALDLLEKFDLPELKADALRAKAAHLRDNNKLNEALDLANKVLEIYEQLNLTQKIAATHNTVGNIYYRKSDSKNAIKHLERALVLSEL
jgi:tetratricopeptide (TPR) repeat protein